MKGYELFTSISNLNQSISLGNPNQEGIKGEVRRDDLIDTIEKEVTRENEVIRSQGEEEHS